jgi:hypothetical protein
VTEIVGVPDTGLYPCAGREASAGEVQAMPALEDERCAGTVVIFVQGTFDLRTLRRRGFRCLLLALDGKQNRSRTCCSLVRILVLG